MTALTCLGCGLPDFYNGEGDGIGSCGCVRCERCGGNPGDCPNACDDDYFDADDEEYEPLDHPDRQPISTVQLPAGDIR